MNYHDALRYLYGLVDYEKRRIERYSPREFKLERVMTLLDKLGTPQNQYPAVHIAGTKGKGSVSAMVASIAQAGGQKVGLYTSPHLHTYRERIQINREPISRHDLTALLEEIEPIVASTPGVTTFEVTTVLGFLYFARQQVDLAVLEVGLGGRLDATNVITPRVSIITSLSLDHTYLLGKTLPEIAREKGGIIKSHVPVVSAPQRKTALAVLSAMAEERHAPLTVVGQAWLGEGIARTLSGQTIRIRHTVCESPFDEDYFLPLLGDFQVENATVAVAAAARLGQTMAWVTPEVVRTGLQNTVWPGRMEVLQASPPVLVDCAHNPYSARKLIASLHLWFPRTRWVLIYGASNDKDIAGMLQALLPESEHVIVTRSYHPRAAAPYVLADLCAEIGHGAEIAVDPRKALAQAYQHLKPGLGILATGSIFLVADVREVWIEKSHGALPQGDWVDEQWEPAPSDQD